MFLAKRSWDLQKQFRIAANFLGNNLILFRQFLNLTFQLAPSFLLQSLKYSSKDAWQSHLNLKHFSQSLQNIVFLAVIYKPAAEMKVVV